MRYDFELSRYIGRILPPALRKSRILAFAEVMAFPLRNLQDSFATYRQEATYNANLTSQTLLLENHLNNHLDPVARRISIEHAVQGGIFVGMLAYGEEGFWFGLATEAEEGYFVPLRGEDNVALATDFRVNAPATVNQMQLIGYLNNIKLAGKTYDIITI